MIAGEGINRDSWVSFFVFCRIEKWVFIRNDKLMQFTTLVFSKYFFDCINQYLVGFNLFIFEISSLIDFTVLMSNKLK